MESIEIIYIVIGIIVFAVLVFSVRKKSKSMKKDMNNNDFEKFVKQTTNNLGAIDQVLSNFNDRLNELENAILAQKEPEPKEELKYVQTKYYAYEQDGKIIIETYKDNDVKVILPNLEIKNAEKELNNEPKEKIADNVSEESEKLAEKMVLISKKKILDALAQKPYSYRELVGLKISGLQPLNSALNELLKSGEIIKTDDKKYALAKKV